MFSIQIRLGLDSSLGIQPFIMISGGGRPMVIFSVQKCILQKNALSFVGWQNISKFAM